MKINKVKIEICKGDITRIRADALLNPANTQLKMGGGLALTIKKKGGEEIEKEAKKYSPLESGKAIVTDAGRLPVKFVIHTPTMAMDFKTNQNVIRKSLHSALELAKEKNLKILAIPALGCGTGRFPIKDFAKIAGEEVIDHIYRGTLLKKVIFVLHTQEDYNIFTEIFSAHANYILRKLSHVPVPTVDAIILLDKESIILIERENPPFGWALPGGFVEYNESLEDCVVREVKEETGLQVVDLEQFHTYSQPGRDPRFHTISTVFIVKVKGKPKASSDAKSLKIFKIQKLPSKKKFAFDHWQIIQDWLKSR